MNLPKELFKGAILSDGELAIFYLSLVAMSNEDGVIKTSFRQLADELRMSLRSLRTLLDKLKTTQLVTQVSTQYSTQLFICQSESKRKRPTQSPTQVSTQLATQVRDPNEIDFERFMDVFNKSVENTAIPQIRLLNDNRKRLLKTRATEHGKASLMEIIRRSVMSDLLAGRKTEWHASFDWIFKKENFLKILEGNYDNGTNNPATQSPGRGQHRNPGIDECAEAVYRLTHTGGSR